MAQQNLFEAIRRNLNGRPGQPIVLGVCQALSERSGLEPWIFRAGVIVLGVFASFAALAAYVLAGLFMPETASRTRGVFRGLGIWLQEWTDKLARLGREFLNGHTQRNGNSG